MLTTRNYGILLYSDLSTSIKSFRSFQKLLKAHLLTIGFKLLSIIAEQTRIKQTLLYTNYWTVSG